MKGGLGFRYQEPSLIRSPGGRLQVSKLKQRRMEAGSITWGVRSAVSVCLSAMLVLDGKLVRYISQGYGIWAIITCINCNEKFQARSPLGHPPLPPPRPAMPSS